MPQLHSIYYYDHGGGKTTSTPIVLLHGAGGSHMAWPVEFRRLRIRRVISIDLPGHGKSSSHCLQSIQAYARRVYAFVMEMGLFHFIPVGCSLGGAIALQLAVDHPDQVCGLGLVACANRFSIPHELMNELSLPRYYTSALSLFEECCFASTSPRQLRRNVMQPLARQRPALLYNDLRACVTFDFSARVKEIQCPTWLACGQEDALVSLADSRMMARQLKSSQLDILPGCGHMLLVEKPETAVEKFQRFLKAHEI